MLQILSVQINNNNNNQFLQISTLDYQTALQARHDLVGQHRRPQMNLSRRDTLGIFVFVRVSRE